MRECCVCFEKYTNGVKCFGVCSLEICVTCFNAVLKINRVDLIEYSCPQCRFTSIKNEDKKFTKFLNNNKKIMKRIIFLLESRYEDENKRMLENTWIAFNARVNGQDILRFTPAQLAELTYG